MKDIFILLNNSIRKLFEKTTTWLSIIIALQILSIWLVVYIYLELSNGQYHFYSNTTTSLEKIHNVKIDKYDGDFLSPLSTENKLIRKQSRKFHLKYLFK